MQLNLITYSILDRVIGSVKKLIENKTVDNPNSVPITRELVADIFDSQSKAIKKGMENKETVKLDGLGKFMIKAGRRDALRLKTKLRDQGLSEEEIEKELIKRRDTIIQTRIRKPESTQINLKLK